jgi:hypothetical protein
MVRSDTLFRGKQKSGVTVMARFIDLVDKRRCHAILSGSIRTVTSGASAIENTLSQLGIC